MYETTATGTIPEYEKLIKTWNEQPLQIRLPDSPTSSDVELRQWCMEEANKAEVMADLFELADKIYQWVTQTGIYAATKSVEDTAVSSEE